jgi:predicted secreted acid phosphatase
MKNHSMLINTLFAATCALLLGSKTVAEPMNISTLKTQLIEYQHSGEYDKELATAAQDADEFISQAVADNKSKPNTDKLAIVLDIDETSLSNYQSILAHNFCADQKTIDRGIELANDPAIKPILELYEHALKQGVAVFFITGRTESLLDATTKNLKAAGYKEWAGLYMRPNNDLNESVIPFKTQARETIAHAKYHIIASIGDQQSDLVGGFADKTFKLPNPFYFLP